ncbi:hemagglutinin repeat-containing protein [Bartonella gliris]|uniref:hemagglutinin repeat-containing protein n=1 Tax=Bartonella gliris TaxID=3004109 RepID=UPI0038738A9F
MRYERKAKKATLFGVLVSSTMLKKVLLGGIGFSVLLHSATLQAQISADPNANSAHRPDIVAAPNGVPSIDIVTPNGKGLSHNKYYNFNIGNSGVIFNNHAREVGQSQLGGIMRGNPHLRYSGSAKVILNEVTSGNRSALSGPAEVFGRQADVIIANPNGISCDGCGFINTPHATLTTGVPEIDANGFLKGFEVKGGDITFGRKGGNFFSSHGLVDIVDIVSRTVHFEGPVAGREIGVTAGTGHFDYASREMKELTDISGKPEYAIDGATFGALQADSIKLVATEKGVGVRMRDDMAANAGQLQLSADGKISLKNIFGHDGVILKSKSDNLSAKRITSKKHVEIFAGNSIYYDQLMGYGTATLTSVSGEISIENELSVRGDVRLKAKTLDLSNDRSHIKTLQTLTLNADTINVSGSTLIYGGLDFNSTNALEIHKASLRAVTEENGFGDILFIAPSFMVDKETSVLAARDLTIKTGRFENSGQLAAGQDLAFIVTGDATNSKTGLIYARGNGAFKIDGIFLNDFGAILAEHDLFFTNAQGTGKSFSLVNKAGFIQAGGNLIIQTKTLKNEADSTPVVIDKKIKSYLFTFDKPDNYDSLNKEGLFNKKTFDRWSKEYIDNPFLEHREFILEEELWDRKEKTYGQLTLNDRTVYKAFTWQIAAAHGKDLMQTYVWNDWSYMTEKQVTQAFSHKPTVQGMIQSSGNLIINADDIENRYSTIEAGGNANIHAGMLTNSGATTYRNTYVGCRAGTDNCYAYNADGSRNVSLDLENDTFRHIGSEVTDTVSALVRAGGTLNLVVDQINNTAAEGSISGSAHFEAKSVVDNPLGALNGLTVADSALFIPKINRDSFPNGSDLPLPKFQSGEIRSSFSKQNFFYKTRADFLDVSNFYGFSYYLKRIGYNPDREIFFLGDAYFEKQLIEKQMRDLVGQGLGKGSFIPGSNAIEQVKTLLDKGADYAKAHHLPFGEALTPEQLASLKTPMVIYMRQKVKEMDVYAPVLYIPEKERASFISAGALMTGKNVDLIAKNMTNSTINNSGRVEASHQLHINSGNILNKGGNLAAGDNIVLVADNNIHFEAGRTSVESSKTVLKTDAISAGGNAVVSAKQDVTTSGACIATRGISALSAEQGSLSLGSAATTNRIGQRNVVTQNQTKVSSGSLIVLLAGKDLNVASSCIKAHDNLYLKAAGNVSIDATHNSTNNYVHGETSRLALHKGSYLGAGKSIAVTSGRDVRVSASTLEAKGDIALGAQGGVTVRAKQDQMEYHLQSQNTTIDRHVSAVSKASIKAGGNMRAVAGQDGKQHDLSITGSVVTAEGKVELKASNDILITNAENSLQRKVSVHTCGGVFCGSKSVHNNVENTQVVSTNITGGKEITIESEKDIQIVESVLIASIADGTKDQVKANISLMSGGNITITGVQEQFNQQVQWTKKAFLSKKSSNKSQAHTTTVSSNLGAEGNIVMKAKNDTIISCCQVSTGKDIALIGESVSVNGMKDYHNTYSQEHESDLGVCSGSNLVSIWKKKSKTQTDESVKHKGSSFGAGGNINIAAKKSDVTVVGSDFTANNDITFSAVCDVNIKDGCDSYTSNVQEKRSAFSIQVTKNHSDSSIDIGYTSSKDKENQEVSSSVQSHFTAGRDIQINSDHNVHLQAADIGADRDVKIYAGNDITLSESHNISNGKETYDKLVADITISANVGIVSTIQGGGDVAQHFAHGNEKHKISKIDLKGYDLYNQDKNFYSGIKGGTTKDTLLNTGNVSANITAGFKSDKKEKSFNTSMAVTDKIKAGRAVSIEANKGTLHDVGADVIAGAHSAYIPNNDEHNNEHNGEIILKAGRDINLKGAKNVQSSTEKFQSSSLNISYGISGMDWGGSASFSQGKDSNEEVQHKNSHIVGMSTVHITSGTNTALEGVVVSGKGVKADIGGDFTIASRSDSGQTSNKQKSISVGFDAEKISDSASINLSFQQDKSSSHYNSVVEQSGIKAGEQGFDIIVTGKTTLTGCIIDSTASADKNTLTNKTITTSDIANNAEAKANSDGISIAVGGALQQGKYGIAKNLAKNALDHWKVHDSAKGETKVAISNGTIILTDEVGQKMLTGKGAEETIKALNRDTAKAHQGIEQLDVAKLEHIARENRKMATQFLEEGFKYSDEAYKTMFIKEHAIAVVDRDKDGNILYLKDENGLYVTDSHGNLQPQSHYLTAEEKQHLQAGSDGKVHVSFNGIFTSPDAAAAYAVQHADNKNEPLYFVVFPKADSGISEMMIAGYQKFMENNFFGLTNSTQEAQDLVKSYGNIGLELYAHSRGGMTVGNALQSLNKQGVYGLAGETEIKLFAPAFNAQSMANMLDKLSDGKQISVGLENHRYDFVGTVIGGNPYTFEQIPVDSNGVIETFKIMMDSINVHNCLGSGKLGCKQLYGTPQRQQIYSREEK